MKSSEKDFEVESKKTACNPADIQLGIDEDTIFPNMMMNLISFMQPAELTLSAWLEHIPAAFWLIGAHRPQVLVELGTHYGSSYFAFCQAIEQLRLPTRSYAVDTWKGDEHAGVYGEKVYASVQSHNTRFYSRFSALMRMTFDEAVPFFEDGEVDLLHIDGYHTYEAVKHDFESWLPKLSKRGVVIIHDSNERKNNFGVFRFVDELRKTYPCFEFAHGHGLTIVGVGAEQTTAMQRLFSSANDETMLRNIQEIFARLGKACLDEYTANSLKTMVSTLRAERDRATKEAEQLRLSTAQKEAERRAEIELTKKAKEEANKVTERLRQQVAEIEKLASQSEMQNASLGKKLSQVTQQFALRIKEDEAQHDEVRRMAASLATLSQEAALREQEIQNIRSSFSWRLTTPLRSTLNSLRSIKQRFTRQPDYIKTHSEPLIDQEWYLRIYPDVAASGMDPQQHYLAYGKAEGRYPNREAVQQVEIPGFDADWYLKTYPDVAAAGISPTEHYLIYGQKEGRFAAPTPLLPDAQRSEM